ncbi:hybrid sensor histidine kinase/response regulator [Lujinxingia litoralis]|uniref:histidine kinase n=1 Tax=Lujinxingia litoralis TaxID=2211119 RepID=A0A328C502_9DELT|nr:response regulator [Lujinxingia litoralis]RAL21180.1 hybrid sensor histidine kinase/response regulator [Lujinxingia litoralis]
MLQKAVDYFIPENLRGERNIERKRAELAIKTVFFMVIWGPIIGLFSYTSQGSLPIALAIGAGTISIALAPFALKARRNMRVAGNLILLPFYALIVGLVFVSGGIQAASISWLALVPMFALLFFGAGPARIWMAITVLTWLAIFGADVGGFPFTDSTSPAGDELRRLLEIMGLGCVMFSMFVFKDRLQDWLIGNVKEREAETRAVVDTAPDGILAINADGVIEAANPATARIFGAEVRELYLRPIAELVPSLSASRLAQAAQDGSLREATQLEARRHGEDFPIEVALGVLGDSARASYVLILRDITERVAAKLALEKARDEALEANRAKSTFLANMSHELRTPLNAVIGYSEIVLEEIDYIEEEGGPAAEMVRPFRPDLKRIRSAGKHLLAVINDILDLSKIEAGKMTTHIELFDISELLDDVAGTVAPLAKQNFNALTLTLDPNLRFMRSDPTKVRQIVFNLLSNACKFTRQGQVKVDARSDDDTNTIVLRVEDTGIGMTPEELQEIFEAFTQADTSTTREFGGTGLGLTITRHFASLLGGTIEVESHKDQGTIFTVRLSADLRANELPRHSPAEERDTPRPDPGPGPGDTVLVIDDDPTVRDLLRRMLEREGFEVVAAASGTEGLHLAAELIPAAITLDVMMPQLDGWSTLARLKSDPQLEQIPVIMVTMVSETSRGYALGADHYLMKPIDRDALLTILDTYRSEPDQPQGRVLFVEDDEPTRSLIARVLTKEGWQVDQAENGLEGLDALGQKLPDLILLDLMMPKMDGFEFLRQVRKDEVHATIPVVVITAKELSAADRQELAQSTREILPKGGDESDLLLEQIRALVQRVREHA